MPFWPNVTPAYCGWGPTPPLALNPGGTSAHFGSRYSFCPIFPKTHPSRMGRKDCASPYSCGTYVDVPRGPCKATWPPPIPIKDRAPNHRVRSLPFWIP